MRLTELENAVLGVIGQSEPCSTYQVRRAFARSSTNAWSASSGTIYPVIERLLRLKLAAAKRRRGDARGRRDLTLTRAGRRALNAWIMRIEQQDASASPDPVRTRAHHLRLLPLAARAEFLECAEQATVRAIADVRAFLQEERRNSEFDYLASLGALYQLQARLKWLRVVRTAMKTIGIKDHRGGG